MDFNTLQNLISTQNLEAAEAWLRDLFSKPLSQEEMGAALVDITMLYMSTKNAADEKYIELLRTSIDRLKEISKVEKSVKEKVDLASTRSALHS